MTYEQKVSRQYPVMSLELKLLASDFFSPFPLFENWQGLRQLSWPRDGSPMQRKQRYHSSLDHSLWDCYVKSREAFFQMGEIIACSCVERIDPWEREKWVIQKKEASISVKMSLSEWEGMGSSAQVNGLGLDRSTVHLKKQGTRQIIFSKRGHGNISRPTYFSRTLPLITGGVRFPFLWVWGSPSGSPTSYSIESGRSDATWLQWLCHKIWDSFRNSHTRNADAMLWGSSGHMKGLCVMFQLMIAA